MEKKINTEKIRCDHCGKYFPQDQLIIGEWGDYCSPECERADSLEDRIVEAYDTLKGTELIDALKQMGVEIGGGIL